ncbi:MAG: DNA adenine methylase [Thermoplasmatales archaeon]
MDIKPVLKYPGSKWNLARWICSYMPPHRVYLEPFFGSGAVFFTKDPARIETINDLDGHVINLFRVLRERSEELVRLIELTPWSRQEWQDLLTSASADDYYVVSGDPVEDARRLLVRMWMGRGSKTSDRTGWRFNIQSKVGTAAMRVWQGLPDRILQAARRLKDAQIDCRPALEVIGQYHYPEVLIYADPPYVMGTRGTRWAKRQYKFEMSEAEHLALLDALDAHPGPVLLSGYASKLYDERLAHWLERGGRLIKDTIAEGGRWREEVLWLNPKAMKQLGLIGFGLGEAFGR